MCRGQGTRAGNPANGLGERLAKLFENALGDRGGRIRSVGLFQGLLHGVPECRVLKQGQDRRLKPERIRIGLLQQERGPGSRQSISIVELVVVLSRRQGDEDRRELQRCQFGQGRGSGTADHCVGSGQGEVHFLEEGAHHRASTERVVCGLNRRMVWGA